MAEQTPDAAAEATESTTAVEADDSTQVESVDEWKAHSRKHERAAKKALKEAEELRAQIEEIRSAGQSDQEKALAKAREEARKEALAEAQIERRNDRLEVAVTRLAARTFADTEDVVLYMQRAITAGDIDADDIFDEQGHVNTKSLQSALDDLAERKPHWKADPTGGRPTGTADAGRGTPAPASPDEAHNDLLLQIAGLKR